MKIIFLNAWNAKVRDDITVYINAQIPTTDVFCFQEAYDDMKALCAELLSEYEAYTDYKFVTEDDDFPQATYVRKHIPVRSSGSILKDQPNCGLGLYVEVEQDSQSTFICNFHGMSRPVDKRDEPNRLTQSKTLIDFFKSEDRVVIGGDFNLFPDTNSIRRFDEGGYRDLIKEFDIKTTRNQISWDMYPNSNQYFADYVFVSPSISLRKFIVPDNQISDHLPLEVEID
ncbi:MAG TPA: endonuclease/exonuclease/phosphatase family protein [Verrucomicrobiae bacterium]|nr:endonuclease/exonuclease/phosphatase family protein [Verrucomicrobiae bacterium]